MLADDLDRWRKGEPIHARPVSSAEKFWSWCRRKPALATFVAATCLLLLAILIGSPIAALRIDRARKLAEVRLYAADMFAAQQAFESSNLGRARELLKAHWPSPGEPDLRGFEWRYLWNLCRGDNFHTFAGHSKCGALCCLLPGRQNIGLRRWGFVCEAVGCREPTTRGHAAGPSGSCRLACLFQRRGDARDGGR